MKPLEDRDCPATWTGAIDTDPAKPGNWEDGMMPGLWDTVIFPDGSGDCYGLSGSFSVVALYSGSGSVTFTGSTAITEFSTESGSGSVVVEGSLSVYYGYMFGGSLEVEGDADLWEFGVYGGSIEVDGEAEIDQLDLNVGFVGLHGGGTIGEGQLRYGTLALGDAVTAAVISLSGASITQAAGADLTVNGEREEWSGTAFSWTLGSINAAGNLANVIITGLTTTALIAPYNAGTVTSGSTLKFENGASGTISAGTINFNGDAVYSLAGTGTNLTIDTSLGDVVFQQPAAPPAPQPAAIIGPGTKITIEGGNKSTQPSPIGVHGELQLIEGSTLTVTGGGNNQYSVATPVSPGSGIISIENGSTLRVSHGVGIGAGGLLQSRAKPGAGQDQRLTFPALLDGNLDLKGGDFTIDAGPSPHVWGTFNVTGNVKWTGGTFHVTVDPVAANLNFDQWIIDGTLTVTVNVDSNGNPVAGAPKVDVLLSPNNAPAPAQVWRGFLYAAGGITRNGPVPTANNPFLVAPEADDQTWDLQS